MDPFTTDALEARVAERGLILPRDVLANAMAAIIAGQHLVLTGVPGTGKTTLAQMIGELARDAVLSTGSLTVTADSSWSVDNTVGWYEEDTTEGAIFHAGVFLRAIETGSWLVVDELNRANIDQALGPLFTVLSHQAVVLPFTKSGFVQPIAIVPAGEEPPPDTHAVHVPRAWRLIATMNGVDRTELHQMSRALLRRFAFVELPCPSDEEIARLVEGPGAIVADLLPLRGVVELGPALFIAGAEYASARSADGASDEELLEEVLTSFILPQLDGHAASILDGHLDRTLSSAARKALGSALTPAARAI